jgi:hypothetical protein
VVLNFISGQLVTPLPLTTKYHVLAPVEDTLLDRTVDALHGAGYEFIEDLIPPESAPQAVRDTELQVRMEHRAKDWLVHGEPVVALGELIRHITGEGKRGLNGIALGGGGISPDMV